MKEQYDFSDISYEHIGHESSMPFKTFFISVGYRGGHWHREFEIILLLEGELTVTRGNTVQTLKKGDLYLINPYEMHGFIKGSETNLLLVLQVDPVISSACPTNLHCYNFNLTPGSDTERDVEDRIKEYMADVMREVISRKSGYEYVCMGAVNSLVALLIRRVSNIRDTEAEVRSRIEWVERLNKIIDYINSNYDKDIGLQDLADLVGLSTFYVSHLIKENTGLSFRENLSMIRTHHAVNLMLTTNRKLVDIAFDAGFSDIKYFNRSFKRLYGETPSRIRKRDNWKDLIRRESGVSMGDYTDFIPLLDRITSL